MKHVLRYELILEETASIQNVFPFSCFLRKNMRKQSVTCRVDLFGFCTIVRSILK